MSSRRFFLRGAIGAAAAPSQVVSAVVPEVAKAAASPILGLIKDHFELNHQCKVVGSIGAFLKLEREDGVPGIRYFHTQLGNHMLDFDYLAEVKRYPEVLTWLQQEQIEVMNQYGLQSYSLEPHEFLFGDKAKAIRAQCFEVYKREGLTTPAEGYYNPDVEEEPYLRETSSPEDWKVRNERDEVGDNNVQDDWYDYNDCTDLVVWQPPTVAVAEEAELIGANFGFTMKVTTYRLK